MIKTLIITGLGINSEEETAFCFQRAGSEISFVHINDLIQNHKILDQHQILAFPGGFSYGDHTGSGNAFANKIKNHLLEPIIKFADQDKLIIGICNGFQILTNLGLLPRTESNHPSREAVLMPNESATFQCHWTDLKISSQKCVWTKDINEIELPIAHGEGNFYCSPATLKTLISNDQIALQYKNNPNGSLHDIAGICDPTGKIFGLMPHPERFNSFANHPNWQTKKEVLVRQKQPIPEIGDGQKIFDNAINYFQ
ncbi:phosphoribosylformylglycinamidine synthase I [Candidatus Peregrinibacteria bacterium HGW-Peregrinibacteria-1]|jgi:phosphoribosylformylglycinamidine synthase|nr:MAG: phosphoribosylformylglycinamidine synthase I [Candidatus Peregrinibacteria bacterium HGW-Peregrinibacteria-1]